ncbi:hypothetical protein MKUB_50140 [Mycobacterium kubicae]|uniref:Uncharacterized protein n=1 Tax=Mycobacterium kubicae TaxID=120959 RepID=A0ABQ1BUX1_9MYCO|nr:hypothetical protein MKUB_50140 [Mycobacterium kubicae]
MGILRPVLRGDKRRTKARRQWDARWRAGRLRGSRCGRIQVLQTLDAVVSHRYPSGSNLPGDLRCRLRGVVRFGPRFYRAVLRRGGLRRAAIRCGWMRLGDFFIRLLMGNRRRVVMPLSPAKVDPPPLRFGG